MRKNKLIIMIVLLIVIISAIIYAYIKLNSKNKFSLEDINLKIMSLSLYEDSNLEEITIDNVYEIFGIDKSYVKEIIR